MRPSGVVLRRVHVCSCALSVAVLARASPRPPLSGLVSPPLSSEARRARFLPPSLPWPSGRAQSLAVRPVIGGSTILSVVLVAAAMGALRHPNIFNDRVGARGALPWKPYRPLGGAIPPHSLRRPRRAGCSIAALVPLARWSVVSSGGVTRPKSKPTGPCGRKTRTLVSPQEGQSQIAVGSPLGGYRRLLHVRLVA